MAKILSTSVRHTHTHTYTHAGGVLEQTDIHHRVAFAFAVESLKEVTTNQTPANRRGTSHQVKEWRSLIKPLRTADTLSAYRNSMHTHIHTACDLLQTGVWAVFGPSAEPAQSQVQSLCDTKEIPHVSTSARSSNNALFSINLHPSPLNVGSAIAATIRYYRWSSFVLLYEHSYGEFAHTPTHTHTHSFGRHARRDTNVVLACGTSPRRINKIETVHTTITKELGLQITFERDQHRHATASHRHPCHTINNQGVHGSGIRCGNGH